MFGIRVSALGSTAIAMTVIMAVSTAKGQSPDLAIAVADLHVVDCLLPGQVRRLGQMRYITARRPIHTTAADCRIRGGEYTEYDRADHKSALGVWLPAAEAGDAEAQVNVGEIFEKGLGTEPNYEAALIWYQKAADQAHPRGLFNLATLYERGLGVEADKLKALNLYRRAWGMPEDSVLYQSAAWEAQKVQRDGLEQTIQAKDGQITLLQGQVKRLQQDIEAMISRLEAANQSAATSASTEGSLNQQPKVTDDHSLETESLKAQVAQLETMIQGLSQEKVSAEQAYKALPVFREPQSVAFTESAHSSSAAAPENAEASFGQYYALIIGNSDYDHIEDLATPQKDVERIGELLEQRYGFSVKILQDMNDVAVMHAINDLNEELDEDDNLLIYYAGHGSRMQMGDIQTGYWLPVNADPPPRDTHWIANEAITRHLGRLQAKRILVVADSCYAGLLSDAPDYLFLAGGNDPAYTAEFLRYKLSKRSRLMISSGGDFPVLDNLGNGNSVFAGAFINVLEQNDKILSGPELFSRLKPMVEDQSNKVGYRQIPSFKTIKIAGNEAGDFFFVPQDSSQGR